MALIPNSHMTLGRERRSLSRALRDGDWQAIQQGDATLIKALGEATEDPNRDLASLLKEMREVIVLYQDILAQCNHGALSLADQVTSS